MPPESLEEILKRASVLADQDLGEIYEKHRSRDREIYTESLKTVSENANKIAIEEHEKQKSLSEELREGLPKKARRRYDKELRSQILKKRDQEKRRAYATNKSNKRMLRKLDTYLRNTGIENPNPQLFPHHLWKQTKHILADSTGWACRFYSRMCWHKIGVGLANRAALCYDDQGRPRYSYAGNSRGSYRARAVLALALLLLGLSRPTRRRNHGWSRIIRAIPQTEFLSALSDPSNKNARKPFRNTLNGSHRKTAKDDTSGSVGYLTALKRIGLVYTRQAWWKPGGDPSKLKGWEDIQPEEMLGSLHPSGWYTSTARYWIVADRFQDPRDAEKRARLWLAWLAGNIPWQRDEHGAYVPISEGEIDNARPPKPPD